MKGIPLHPLRIAALDRMKVLRVPMTNLGNVKLVERATPADWNAGRAHPNMRRFEDWKDKDSGALFFIETGSVVFVPAPYAPGDYFLREVTWEPTSIIVADVYYDADLADERRETVRGLFYKRIPAGRMNKEYARHLLTLGPPVPCRLGEVTEEMAEREVLDYCRFGDGDYEEDPEQVGYPSHEASIEYANRAYRRAFARQWDYLYPRHPYSPERWTWGYPVERRGSMIPRQKESTTVRVVPGRNTGDEVLIDDDGVCWIKDTTPYSTGKITGIRTGNTIRRTP